MLSTLTRVNCCSALLIKNEENYFSASGPMQCFLICLCVRKAASYSVFSDARRWRNTHFVGNIKYVKLKRMGSNIWNNSLPWRFLFMFILQKKNIYKSLYPSNVLSISYHKAIYLKAKCRMHSSIVAHWQHSCECLAEFQDSIAFLVLWHLLNIDFLEIKSLLGILFSKKLLPIFKTVQYLNNI